MLNSFFFLLSVMSYRDITQVLLKSPSEGETAKRQHHYPDDERDRGTHTKSAIHFSDYCRGGIKEQANRKRDGKGDMKRKKRRRARNK